MSSLSVTIPLAAFLLYLGLLVVTLIAGRQNVINRAFAVYLLGMMVWSFSSFAVRIGLLTGNPLFWTRILVTASIGLPIFFYAFVRAFLVLKWSVWPLYLGYLLYSGSVLITFLTDWVVPGARVEGPRYYLQQGPVMPFIAAWGATYMLLAAYLLLHRYLESGQGDYRNRIRYPLIGVTIVILGTLSNQVPALTVYPLDIAANAVNAIILAYAIQRYQLINITPVLRQGLTYVLLMAAIGGGYLLSFLVFERLTQRFGTAVLLLAFLLGVVISVAFPPLRDRWQLLINRLLFRRRYEEQRMLQRLSSTAASIIELGPLTRLILDEVTATMEIESACILLRDTATAEFHIVAGTGVDDGVLGMRWRPDHPVLRWLGRGNEVLSHAEVDVKPEFRALWGKEREEMDRLGTELLIPLQVKGDLIGVFAVGPKSARVPYSADDKISLATLANQTAVAVENARLYATEQRRLRESLILLDIAAAVGSTLDLTQMLKRIAQRTAEACGAHRCSILLLDESRQYILPLMSQFAAGAVDEKQWNVFRSGTYTEPLATLPILDTVFGERQPLVLTGDELDSLPKAWVEPFHVESLAVVPLVSRDQVIGAMALDHGEPQKRFTEEQINLAKTIASQVAAAIGNARLYGQTIEEKAKTEVVLRETFSGIVVLDGDLRIVSMNPGAELVTGFASAEVWGKHLSEIFGAALTEPDGPLARAVATGEKVPPVESRLYTPQGAKDVLLGVTRLSVSPEAPVQFLLSFADISKLKEVDRLKSSIVANVSHELRTPLSSIKAYTELLLLGAEEGDVALRQEWLSVIDRETDRLAELISNLLDLSRLEAEPAQLQKAQLDLAALVADVVSLLEVQARQRDIRMVLSIQPGLPPVLGDEALLRSAVRNLVSNAIKFGRDGGEVSISLAADGGNLTFSVKDDGIGIPPEALPHLFTKFFRVPSATTAQMQGTGLGLALAKEAILAHGGDIRVESAMDKGSSFTVVIPITPENLREAGSAKVTDMAEGRRETRHRK